MNQTAILLKNSSIKENFKNTFVIKGKRMNFKRRRSSSFIMKPNLKQFVKEDKTLKNAYKNVIRVITNILDNIEEEKTNGKINYLNKSKKGKITLIPKQLSKINTKMKFDGTQISMKTQKKSNKNQISKDSHFFSNISNNSFIVNNSPSRSNKIVNVPFIQIIKPKEDKEIKNKLINEEFKNSIICTRLNKSKFNQSNKNNNRLKVDNSFVSLFTPSNKNINDNCNNTNIYIPKKIKKVSFVQKEPQNSLSAFNDDSNISLSSSKIKALPSSKKVERNITKHEKSPNLLNLKSLGKNDYSRSDNKSTNIKKNLNIPKSKNNFQSKILNSNKSINQKLYEYENNEITDLINKLPEDKNCIEQKKNFKKRKSLILTKELKDIIDLKLDANSLLNHFQNYQKERDYRCLLFKGSVYDSLNDEEEFEEEIEDNYCYLEPDSTFLYIFDSIIFLSSLIILLYLPYYLAKNLYFCQNIFYGNTLIFYIIDILFILDLIINFYRSYYNFDEYLVKQNYLISINYFKTWFLFDLITSVPIFSIIKSLENNCIMNNIYNDTNLNNNGIHSHYYNTNPNKMHYLLILIKLIKTFKIFKTNISVHKIGNILYGSEFLTDWGNVLLYSFFFFIFS